MKTAIDIKDLQVNVETMKELRVKISENLEKVCNDFDRKLVSDPMLCETYCNVRYEDKEKKFYVKADCLVPLVFMDKLYGFYVRHRGPRNATYNERLVFILDEKIQVSEGFAHVIGNGIDTTANRQTAQIGHGRGYGFLRILADDYIPKPSKKKQSAREQALERENEELTTRLEELEAKMQALLEGQENEEGEESEENQENEEN